MIRRTEKTKACNPNKETKRSIIEANKGLGIKKYKTVDLLFNSIQPISKKAGARGKKARRTS